MLQTDRGQFYAYKPKSQTMSSVLRPLKNNLVAVKKKQKKQQKKRKKPQEEPERRDPSPSTDL